MAGGRRLGCRRGCDSRAKRNRCSEECVVVLSGRLTVEVGDQVHELKTRDSCHFDSNIPHRFRNDGRTSAQFMVSVTPPSY
ncbi:cupin domain-containing protein [Amycolatopsis sp. NPDC049253]|uniref:cupin domain-containing protein n=1 Tax=Amycolatopsis sp. NPDC049253 TaxID=3155274 RepID=UPI003431D10F